MPFELNQPLDQVTVLWILLIVLAIFFIIAFVYFQTQIEFLSSRAATVVVPKDKGSLPRPAPYDPDYRCFRAGAGLECFPEK